MGHPQLTLGVRLRDDARFENFHGARNAAPAARLRQWLAAGEPPVLVLCGEQGTGKSHLLQAACFQTEQQGDTAVCVSLAELMQFEPGVLAGLEHHQLVALDDLDRVAGRREWEEAVFHLYNRIQDAGHRLLVALPDLPAQLPLVLGDLVSRLQHGLLLQLGRYQDDDHLRILQARAEQRGLVLGDEVAGYILKRAPRELGALLAILDRLDENSLRAQRGLTVPFVKSVMGW
ncbi:MAG: DnaA regulatory inactivator Hda [Marinobacter sp.]|nr:DnaA regulatory inactivator Hda [Marinobacter sp.]MDX1635775.1 DnaA regulatory inactivator Hda [Marinobacter sp.]